MQKHCEYFVDGYCKVVKTGVVDGCNCAKKKAPPPSKPVEGYNFQKGKE